MFTKSEDISLGGIINYDGKLGEKPKEKLDSIRLSTFYEGVAGSVKSVKPENLPPTSAATKTTRTELTIKFKYGKVEQILLQKSGVGL